VLSSSIEIYHFEIKIDALVLSQYSVQRHANSLRRKLPGYLMYNWCQAVMSTGAAAHASWLRRVNIRRLRVV
jgi:hypothetical protein